MKPILISGIQPTGKLHIGNYLGALKNFVDLQNSGKYQCYFFIADLHSLTEDFNPKEKPIQVFDLALNYLAAGIDPIKSTVFLQS
ncbi:MAG: tryptophan--tRNA ligase, partial [Patescibacteria group bacterium]